MPTSPGPLTLYLARAGMALLTFAVVTVIATGLVATAFPHLLDGAEILTDSRRPNLVRNLFELLSFIAASTLVVIASFAFIAALRQAREAEKTRLAAIYTQIEQRWASMEMIRSRVAIRELISRYFATLPGGASTTTTPKDIAIYFNEALTETASTNFEKYLEVMGIADYLEFIGMMESRSYLRIEDVAPLLGEYCIYAGDVLSEHLATLRSVHRQRALSFGHASVPEPHAYFSCLATKFSARFS